MADYQFNPNIEQWKAIPDFPGYEVSDHGRVKSFLKSNPKIIKPVGFNKRYLEIRINHNGIRKCYHIHRLVLLTFVGPCPPGMQTCHNDGNKHNNQLNNLRWDTAKNNSHDRLIHNQFPIGENNPKTKLKKKDINKLREMFQNGKSRTDLMEIFNLCRSAVCRIINYQTWNHVK